MAKRAIDIDVQLSVVSFPHSTNILTKEDFVGLVKKKSSEPEPSIYNLFMRLNHSRWI